ncbi:MAG: YceI family protein [Sphingorhabdus sp.]|nr:YceI family protein [Sphingorhabdus sp.]
MRKFLIALPLIIAAPLLAQQDAAPQLPGVADAARVAAGTYAVDSRHSQVNWQVNHFGFNDYFGLFGDIKGTLQIDPANPAAAKVDVTIPISSVATSSQGLTDHLKTADFFDVAKFESARFVSTSVVVDGQKAVIKGDLTMLGVTKPVELETRFEGAGNNPMNKKATVGFHAATTLKRSEWGMTKYVPVVGDDVKLRISVAFEKEG